MTAWCPRMRLSFAGTIHLGWILHRACRSNWIPCLYPTS
jgi:hypothetical protein